MEFANCFVEDLGVLTPGTLKLSEKAISFKSASKSINVQAGDLDEVRWQKLGNKPGLRFLTSDGTAHRFGGLKDSDFEKIADFSKNSWHQDVEKKDLVIKGWNYGNVDVKGKNIEFTWENSPVFEIPCSAVSECVANKNEAFLAFHQKDEAPISLFEMRFHMPTDEDGGVDKAEEFKKAVLAFAGLEAETEQPIALLSDILCMTPRGRYDIKVFPTSIALHGKTYDYKIPIKSITRLFLVPHKDGRHVYFVLSLNPPIRQGQTRYNYLVFEFIKDDDMDLELGLTDEQLQEQFNGALKREMSGPIYEIVSIIFKIVCNLKVTVPGKFIGNTGTPAIACSHKQNPGFLYPMEKGFLFIHKPAMYVRFDEISSCHFARSDGGTVTRTFDFELDLKNGTSLMFNSVEKEENNKLYDYLKKKNLKIRNAQRIDAKEVDSSDDDIDPYKNKMKAEGRQREESDSDSTDEDYDLDKDLKKQKADKDSSEGSGSEPDDEYDSGSEEDSSGTGESEPDDEEDVGSKKSKKEPKQKKERKEKGEKKEKKGKKEKDPNAPKRPMSAYFLWLNANRASLKKDGDSVADVARKGGEAWKKVEGDERKKWEDKAAAEKERYDVAMKEYRANGGGATSSAGTSKKTKSSSKKSSGPSPSKAKSKEFLSSDDSDDADDEEEEPTKKKKKTAEKAKESSEEPESGNGSDGSDGSDDESD